MSTNLIDGRAIAEELHAETAGRVARLRERGVQPGLVYLRVGEDPASRVNVGMKGRMCARLGIWSETRVLAENTTEGELLAPFAEFAQFVLPSSPSSTTWAAIAQAQQGAL